MRRLSMFLTVDGKAVRRPAKKYVNVTRTLDHDVDVNFTMSGYSIEIVNSDGNVVGSVNETFDALVRRLRQHGHEEEG
jgi:ribosome-associated translation inhibitor RaiA